MSCRVLFSSLAGLVLVALTPSSALAQAPTYLAQWGSLGSGPGQFNQPHGIAVDASGFVYVADYGNHRIQKFTSSGDYVTHWGSLGVGNGQFSGPDAVAADGSGNVYVVDDANSLVQKFDSNGTFLLQWSAYARGVAADDRGNVYVPDGFSGRLNVYDGAGTLLASERLWAGGDTYTAAPFGVAADAAGAVVVVADYANQKIKVLGGGTGGSVGEAFTIAGNSDFDWIAYGSSGLYTVVPTADCGSIAMWNGTGSGLGGWVSCGTGNGQFRRPRGMAEDRTGSLYVVDSGNNRIQKFGQAPTPTATQSQSFGALKAKYR
jgi:DNA-binding beta-propeller fold protein YncE